MIDIKELRIGNYYENQDGSFEDVANGKYSKIEKWEDLAWYWSMLPIALTEEWLEKFGFSHIQKDYEEVSQSYQIDYWFKDVACTHVFVDARAVFLCHDVVLNHVHQLQNLYYALTGEELEVK